MAAWEGGQSNLGTSLTSFTVCLRFDCIKTHLLGVSVLLALGMTPSPFTPGIAWNSWSVGHATTTDSIKAAAEEE
jgi:hypothetical protein